MHPPEGRSNFFPSENLLNEMLRKVREQALDDAIEVCENMVEQFPKSMVAQVCSNGIRALKVKAKND